MQLGAETDKLLVPFHLAVTVRGDLNNETERKQKEDATEGGIKFLQKHLS